MPSGVNKRTGLCAALEELKLSQHNVVGIGDAENDHAFLESCECSIAVANAIPALKERATLVTVGARGAGVVESIDRLLATDLSELDSLSTHQGILIGQTSGEKVLLPGHGCHLLICGQSGSGKSTFVTGLLERLMDENYQVCLIDPEGDYEGLVGCQTVGDEKHAPPLKQVLPVLEEPEAQVINRIAVPSSDRPSCFASLMGHIQERRLHTGRPHCFAPDEPRCGAGTRAETNAGRIREGSR